MANILFWTSYLSPTQDALYQRIMIYLGERLGIAMQFLRQNDYGSFSELTQGKIDLAFLCGLPYTKLSNQLSLLAAPILRGKEYQQKPVYFSDLYVNAQSAFQTFSDLSQATFIYNDSFSLSGYRVILNKLKNMQKDLRFFANTYQSNAHITSLRMVASQENVVCSLDSSFVDQLSYPEALLLPKVRVIERIGPLPIPPLVAKKKIPSILQMKLQQELITMHQQTEGKKILQTNKLLQFVPVFDTDYDIVRQRAN